MTPLEYLVPCRHRREILRVLCSERSDLTVRQLARRAGVAYSNAHREVRRLARTGLLAIRRVANALLCRWTPGTALAKALEPLLREAGRAPGEGTLHANLKRWGAPLAPTGRSVRNLSLEETLGHALTLARHRPDVARVWPVVFARNASRVNLEELELVARRLGHKRTLGFFLALTATLLKDAPLRRFAERLHDRRVRRTEDFFLLPRSDRARKLAEENTLRPARAWLFRMNMPMESFESPFRKFVQSHEAFQEGRDRDVPARR
ncbi:MAG: winged helix-turn-helix transcriptional regulator [Planctomycetes bacterium]|nr:winged helix-turn-helix transcriptional regulator [Planctomycetota bacterium]